VDVTVIELVSARNSHLLGNFTGNFAFLATFWVIRLQFVTQIQTVSSNFPKQINRECFRRIRELKFGISETRSAIEAKNSLEFYFA